VARGSLREGPNEGERQKTGRRPIKGVRRPQSGAGQPKAG
jgi:hypothetical protein